MPRPQPGSPYDALQKSARRKNDADPAHQNFFLLAVLCSLLIVPTFIGILIWQLGWTVLWVLGGGLVLFVVGCLLRDGIQSIRAQQYRASLLKKE